MNYCYIQTEPQLWTVGCNANGKWEPESDHDTKESAAKRVRFLNGGEVHDDKMSMRDKFAIAIINALINTWSHPEAGKITDKAMEQIIENGYRAADKMIDLRTK